MNGKEEEEEEGLDILPIRVANPFGLRMEGMSASPWNVPARFTLFCFSSLEEFKFKFKFKSEFL